MKSTRSKVICAAAVVCAAAGLWILGSNPVARAQQPGPGPTRTLVKRFTRPRSRPSPTWSSSRKTSLLSSPRRFHSSLARRPPRKRSRKRSTPTRFTLSPPQSNLVNVDVLVTDKNGNPITGLGKKNFKVLDDGVPQSVTNFSTAEAPMTVTMLIEFSNKWWGYLYLALEDAYKFLNFMEPKDWVAVIDFDMQTHILQDFTHDRYQVRSALDTLRMPGFSETNLYDALSFTIDRMKNVGGRKAIVPIVTGFDTFSKLTYGQMLKIAKGSDTPIYPVSILEWVSIRYGDSIDTLQARNALTSIARYSGGEAYFPRFEGALPDIYRQIAGQLRHQYSVGFIPTDSTKNGKYHKLNVELVDAQGNPLIITNQKGKKIKYRVVAREGYFSPKA